MMGTYEEIINDVREEILSLRQLSYPKVLDTKTQDILALLIMLRYITIDSACAALQGSNQLVELSPAVEIREKIEQQYLSAEMDTQAKQTIQRMLDKIDTLAAQTRRLLSIQEQLAPSDGQNSFTKLTETVYKAQGQLDAESMHLFLESYGFPNKILQESAGIVLALTVGKLGEAEVRVSPGDADQAKRYIDAMKANVFMLSEVEEKHLQSFFPEDETGNTQEDMYRSNDL